MMRGMEAWRHGWRFLHVTNFFVQTTKLIIAVKSQAVYKQHKQCAQLIQEFKRYIGMSVGIAIGYCQVTTGNEVLAQVSALQSVALKKIKL